MHSIRHHPASVRTQIRQFGRGATGHGSDQDVAHSGGSVRAAQTRTNHGALADRPGYGSRAPNRRAAAIGVLLTFCGPSAAAARRRVPAARSTIADR